MIALKSKKPVKSIDAMRKDMLESRELLTACLDALNTAYAEYEDINATIQANEATASEHRKLRQDKITASKSVLSRGVRAESTKIREFELANKDLHESLVQLQPQITLAQLDAKQARERFKSLSGLYIQSAQERDTIQALKEVFSTNEGQHFLATLNGLSEFSGDDEARDLFWDLIKTARQTANIKSRCTEPESMQPEIIAGESAAKIPSGMASRQRMRKAAEAEVAGFLR